MTPYYTDTSMSLYHGDVLDVMRGMPDESVQCVVTSPPYWGLRDYGVPGQLGLEPTPAEYVDNMVRVFAEVRRILRPDGTCWLNLGDSYCGSGKGGGGSFDDERPGWETIKGKRMERGSGRWGGGDRYADGLKPKDLVGIPWRVAFALQADGWWLRSDIIWAKPNPMPESVTDRPTKSHEYLFLLTKSAKYYYDADAVREPHVRTWDATTIGGSLAGTSWHDDALLGGHGRAHRKASEPNDAGRNKHSVWTVSTQPLKDAHFATFPPKLIEPCILAGSKPGDVVLDPFVGSGTTPMVARKHGRKAVGIDISATYLDMAIKRNAQQTLWFSEIEATPCP